MAGQHKSFFQGWRAFMLALSCKHAGESVLAHLNSVQKAPKLGWVVFKYHEKWASERSNQKDSYRL